MTFVETRIEIDKEKNLDTLGVWNLVKSLVLSLRNHTLILGSLVQIDRARII